MKQVISKRLVIAALAMLTVPTSLLAQKEKAKEKDKKDVQQIIITRTGDKNEKMTIEVNGDKVTVNGKDIKDLKDVNVHVNNLNGTSFYRVGPGGQRGGVWSFDHNDDHMSLFDEDENRAMLGVNTEDDDKGALIENITEGSAAEKAGLKKGDIITKVGDDKINDADDLTTAIGRHKPGEKVTINYLRDGKDQKVSAELGKWKGIRMNAVAMPRIEGLMKGLENMDPVEMPRVFNAQGNFMFSGRPRLGLSIQDTDDGKGVKVLEVDDESNAAKAGIQKDDIIMSIDDKEIKGTEDVMRTLRENKDKYNFNFKVQRGGKMQTIEVRFPKKLKTADL
jgi:serine protease Do